MPTPKPRRDTNITVNFGEKSWQTIGPNAHVNTTEIPMDLLTQALGMPKEKLSEQLSEICIHDATHVQDRGTTGINMLARQTNGSLVDIHPEHRQFTVDSNGNVGSHHFVLNAGGFPEPTRSMTMSLEQQKATSDQRQMKKKLYELGAHTADAMDSIGKHEGVKTVEGKTSNGGAMTRMLVPAESIVRAVINRADKPPFPNEGYEKTPEDHDMYMKPEHYNKVVKDLQDAHANTKVADDKFLGADAVVVSMVAHQNEVPEGHASVTLGFGMEGEKEPALPELVSKLNQTGDEKPLSMPPGMEQVTKVTDLK